MKNKKIYAVTAGFALASMLFAAPMTANAMPGDLKEAYTQEYFDNYYENYGEYPREYHTDAYYHLTDYANGENFQRIGAEYVCTGSVNVRDYPNGNIIGGTVKGETYYVEGVCTDCHWYKVSDFGQDAFVYADYLVPKSSYNTDTQSNSDDGHDYQQIDLLMTATVDVNMRKTPNGEIVGSLKKGDEIHVTGNVNNRSWYRCEYNGETVYVCDDYLTPELPQTMGCSHDFINVRDASNLAGNVIGVLRKGDKVKVSAVEGDWYKFTFEKTGQIGYAFNEYFAAIQ